MKSSGTRPFRVGLVVGAIVTVAIALLIIQNGESAQLDWLTFDFKAPLWIMLLLTLGAGAVVWETAKLLWRRGQRLRAERSVALRAVKNAGV
jgi:uncharacterized integral membrane protein